MYKKAGDAYAFLTKTGSKSTTGTRRGDFSALVKNAKPELMELNDLYTQHKMLAQELHTIDERLIEIKETFKAGKRISQKETNILVWEKRVLCERSQYVRGKLASINSAKDQANRVKNRTFCEVYRLVAEIVLPDELRARLYQQTVEIIKQENGLSPADGTLWEIDMQESKSPIGTIIDKGGNQYRY